MMPGMGGMKDKMASAGLNDSLFGRQIAIIGSMTKAERANPDMLKHSRKKRIAAGSGTDASDINKLLKMHRQMADMMKMMGGKGKGGMMKQMMGGLAGKMGLGGLGGGMGGMPDLVEHRSEAARSPAEAGGSRRPRQARWRHARSRWFARSGRRQAAWPRRWFPGPSRPAQEEVKGSRRR
jgi:signal recognition particle subunit SRP54